MGGTAGFLGGGSGTGGGEIPHRLISPKAESSAALLISVQLLSPLQYSTRF